MITAWRLTKWEFRASAFTGAGARQSAGRWNSEGNALVYVAESQPLAALEMIVHFDKNELPKAYAFIPVTFDESLVDRVRVELPANWGTMMPLTMTLGADWLADPKSRCVLAVPTALVPTGTNYLINPQHADFGKLKIGEPIGFAFDERIAAQRQAKSRGAD